MAREKRIVIAFGRFNPPTTGHALLIAFLTKTANRLGADARVYASPTTDAKKNPLPFREKVQFLRQLFPRVTFNDNPAMNTPFSAYADASKAGYKDITVIVGADRVRDFEKMGAYLLPAGSSKYNTAKHIDVSQYRVLAIPRGAGAISATLMRGYAVANDFRSFLAGTPGQNATVAKKIFTSVRRHMRIREQQAYRKAIQQKVLEAKVDHRHRPPIAGHPYHKKNDAELRYIIKDAGKAAKAMQGHDKKAEAKYLDQVNDASTVLSFRRRGGKQVKEATDKLSRPASVSQQMQAAKIIAKSLTGSESRGLTGTGWKKTPHEIIDDAVRHFLKGRHTPKAWQIAGKMLNKATLLGIKWNQKLIRPTTRKSMKMDEEILKPGTRIKIPRPKKGSRFYKDLRGKIIRYDKDDNVYVVDVGMSGPERVAVSRVVKEVVGEAHKWQRPLPPYGDAAILAPGTWVKIPGRQGGRGKVVRHDKGDRHGSPFYIVDVGKYASEKVPAHDVVREDSSPEPPSEVDRLKVRQTTDLLTLKQRQATELMAAKIRDVETKAREAERKATAPKGAAVSAS